MMGPIDITNADPDFVETLKKNRVLEHTIVVRNALYMLYCAARQAKNLAGSAVEIGMFRGGSLMLIASILNDRPIWGFDTFEGLPEPTDKDNHHKKGEFNSSYDEVLDYFKDKPNVKIIKSRFPDNSEFLKSQKFSLVHIDVDLFQSYKDCLEFFYPKMVPGGFMIFDDYGWGSCAGAKKAIDDFLADKPEFVFPFKNGSAMIVIVPETGDKA